LIFVEFIMIDRPSEWADGITDDLCSGFSLDKILSCSRRVSPTTGVGYCSALEHQFSIMFYVLRSPGLQFQIISGDFYQSLIFFNTHHHQFNYFSLLCHNILVLIYKSVCTQNTKDPEATINAVVRSLNYTTVEYNRCVFV
jgi:hypothetical protein